MAADNDQPPNRTTHREMQLTRCYYLGLESEPTLTFTEPASAHRCYARRGRREIDLGHQATYCFTPNFVDCPEFVPLPESGSVLPRSNPSWFRAFLLGRPRLLFAVGATLAVLALVLISYPLGDRVPSLTPTPQVASVSLLPSPSPEALPSPSPTTTATRGQVVFIPTPVAPAVALDPGLVQTVLVPSATDVGWVVSSDPRHHFGDRAIHVGILEGDVYYGAVQFDLTSIPVGSRIAHSTIEFMGLDAQHLDPEAVGVWALRLLGSDLDGSWSSITFEQLASASAVHTLSPQMTAPQLAPGTVNAFALTPALLGELERRLEGGLVSFRLDGPSDGPNNLFTWDTGYAGGFVGWPVLHVIYRPPSTPSLPGHPAEATSENSPTAAATPTVLSGEAPTDGTPTSLTIATTMATSTFLPEVTPLVTATSSVTAAPPPSATASPTATPAATPDRVSTTFPQALAGKIAFYSDRLGQDRAFVMDPDGGNVTLLPDKWVYDVALAAQTTSHDGRTVAQAGWEGNLSDIFLVGATGTPVRRITWMAGGRTQDPAWSHDDVRVAFASSQDGDDEVFIVLSAGSPVRQLTYNQLKSDVHPTWSPDGSQLAYESSDADGRPQVWTIAFDGTDHRNISNNGHRDWSPVWIPEATGVSSPTPTSMPPPTRPFVPSPAPTATVPQVETRITGVNRTTIRTGLQYDDFEIWGSGFQSGVRVFLRQEGRPDIFAHDVSVVDASLIRCKLDLRELRIPYTQEWALGVENPDGGSDQRAVWITPSSESDSKPPGAPEH